MLLRCSVLGTGNPSNELGSRFWVRSSVDPGSQDKDPLRELMGFERNPRYHYSYLEVKLTPRDVLSSAKQFISPVIEHIVKGFCCAIEYL